MNAEPNAEFTQPAARRLEIASGACLFLTLRAGATLVCVAGSVRVDEPSAGVEAANGLVIPVSIPLHAGEAHGVGYGGAVRVTAIARAEVICLDVPSPLGRFLRLATTFFGINGPKNTNNPVVALHKISK
ncbi:hypothetical protein [Achromobacter marplatensis]|uniref:hypothetical protein n=1 Tax=Achromobacter marplatensis TaxID=470868 RepID=UPI0039F660B9